MEEGSEIEWQTRVADRGPDHQAETTHPLPTPSSTSSTPTSTPPTLHCMASLLSLRAPFTPQPIHCPASSAILLYNGQIYDGAVSSITSPENDTAVLASLLDASLAPLLQDKESIEEMAEAVHSTLSTACLVGEWALVLFLPSINTVFFARDPRGRRSLLMLSSPPSSPSTADAPAIPPPFVALGSVASGSPLPGFQWVPLDPHMGLITASWDPQSTHFQCLSALPFHPTLPPPTSPSSLEEAAAMLLSTLSLAVERRVVHVANADSIGILFSGGLDCMVVAGLAHLVLPPETVIELINVAFAVDPNKENAFLVPDRKTGLASAAHLMEVFAPDRTWVWNAVNVPVSSVHEAQSDVQGLVIPGQTVMDFTLGSPLYFAARGASSSVLLSGLGADEQLGGYVRHAAVYRKAEEESPGSGWARMDAELEADLDRIWSRNLGRDDRIIASAGKELRLPYLDEDVVAFLSSLPASSKTDPTRDRGVGDKYLLRKVASDLGLGSASSLPKRAIQFGSRMAKMLTKSQGSTSLSSVQLRLPASP